VEDPKIAVLIPCYQAEKTIGKVITDFRRGLAGAQIFVHDNNCTHATAEIVRQARAVVRREKRQGKGFAVATVFERVDADILVMVDSNDPYEAAAAGALLEPMLKGDADLAVAARQRPKQPEPGTKTEE
jgi:glycosyltransferase involved in cell wall biosynthesis